MNFEVLIAIVASSLITGLLILLRNKFVQSVNSSASNLAHNKESFQTEKAVKAFVLTDPVLWWKDIANHFNIRMIILYITIIAGIFIYGYCVGNQHLPIKVELGYGREAMIKISNKEFLHITKSGEVHLQDNYDDTKAKVIRVLTVKDLGIIEKQLSPIGFQFKPIAVVGYGLGIKGDGGMEVGAGVSFLRYWQGSVEAFLTQKGVYVGTSYRLDKIHLENTSIGIAYGRGYKDFANDQRVIIYGSVKF